MSLSEYYKINAYLGGSSALPFLKKREGGDRDVLLLCDRYPDKTSRPLILQAARDAFGQESDVFLLTRDFPA